MNIQELMKNMENAAYGKDFSAAVRMCYEKDAQDGPCTELENEYKDARQKLTEILDGAKSHDIFDRLFSSYEINRDYAARYGFKCGLTGAMAQIYSRDDSRDGGFNRLVIEDLLMMPGMKRHGEFYSRLTMIHDLEHTISSLLPLENADDLVSIECALDNRVYHAAICAFSMGYYSGFKIMSELSPELAIKNTYKLREVENTLQFHFDSVDLFSL